jgi:MFS family permease
MQRPTWMTRNVRVLSGVSLLQDAASELLYPLLPILLTTVLGAPAAVVGIVEGIAEGVAALMKYVSGRLSDRLGAKRWIFAGYSLAAVGKVVVAAAGVWQVVLVGRVIDRTGKGIRGTPRDALLSREVGGAETGRVFGFHRAMDTLGAVIGPLAGLVILAASSGNIELALWIAVVPAVASAGLVVLVRETAGPLVASAAVPSGGRGAQQHEARTPLPRRATTVIGALTVIALVNFPDALVLLRLSDAGFSAAGVVGAYVLYNLVYAVVSYPAGALSDRWPRSRVYALGLLCFAIGYLGLSATTDPVTLLLLICIYGGFNGFTDGVGKAWISSLVPAAVRGRAMGLFQGLAGGAVLVAGLWAGLAWQVGPGDGVVPLAVAGTCAAVGAVVLLAVGRRWDPAAPQPAGRVAV